MRGEDRIRPARRRTARVILISMAAVLLTLAPSADAAVEPLLAPVFQNGAVLQRDMPVRVYGYAEPNATVHVSLAGHEVETEAGPDRAWQVQLPALVAGGPHVIEVRSGVRQQRVEDLLIGDVWLCAGQSNMVLPVRRTLDADSEIAQAQNPRIRMLTVPEAASLHPLSGFAKPVAWLPTRADSAAEFSATCYYFARELQKQIDVPMGLIVAAWGGSRIQAWISAEALSALGEHEDDLVALRRYAEDPAAGAARWGERWTEWWRQHGSEGPLDAPWSADFREHAHWAEAPAQLGAWERWGVPELADYDGMLWYRTGLRLTRAQARQRAVLELGAADETDVTWVNGRVVGSLYGPGEGRRYALPPNLLRAGENHIVVNVLDTWRYGGLSGPASAHALRFKDGTRVAFDRGWRWRTARAEGSPPRAPWQSAAGLSTLYNGMIAPIGAYGLRGVVWYQGESNTFEAAAYADLLKGLIADWRQRFEAELPWLNVELAGFGAPPTAPADSGWAELREVQRRHAASDPRYGIAAAVDLGDRYDIHPPNKQTLGLRLARLARHLVYAETALAPTGPQPLRAWREDGQVRVQFGGVSGALVSHGAEHPIGFELCTQANATDAKQTSTGVDRAPLQCRYAQAQLQGTRLQLRAANAAQATHVRHGWADNPVITLFDSGGLPAQPFELPITPDGIEE
jgi:sialate O-acetylesterase